MDKDNAMYDFNTMIQKSWTYNRMTTEERKVYQYKLKKYKT